MTPASATRTPRASQWVSLAPTPKGAGRASAAWTERRTRLDIPMPRTAALAGASGLVGQHCLQELLAAPDFDRVLALGRRALPQEHPKLAQLAVDFASLPPATEPVDTAFCALGTTRRKAGSDEAFRRVDLEYVTHFARWARAAGAEAFVLVSSVGADAKSSNLYLGTKGQAEAAVAALGFASVSILRPGLLLGERAESRPVERAAIAAFRFLNPLFVGPLTPYRAIAASEVARAMLAAARQRAPGVAVMQYREITRL